MVDITHLFDCSIEEVTEEGNDFNVSIHSRFSIDGLIEYLTVIRNSPEDYNRWWDVITNEEEDYPKFERKWGEWSADELGSQVYDVEDKDGNHCSTVGAYVSVETEREVV